MENVEKLFGSIDLSWKKLIISAVVVGVCAGVMISLPFTYGTSFMDIGYSYECWVLFAIIIMMNSKSPMDSTLKCLVFFAISQPLMYLLQIPFGRESFEIERFMLYNGWIFKALLSAPLGYIGYYIKKKNIWSFLILLPVFILFDILGLNYLAQAVNNFPYHLLSVALCFGAIVIITLGVFDKQKLKTLLLLFAGTFLLVYLIFFGGIIIHEANVDLSSYGISLNENSYISYASYSSGGDSEIVKDENNKYELRILGYRNGRYIINIETKNFSDEPETCYCVECGFDIMGRFAVNGVYNQ